ncbi:hypothetical protein ACNOYE_34740 [Nannocystaceae bacterium ST9]
MKIEAQELRVADVVRLPNRGEAEVVRRQDVGAEVQIWFRGAEDEPGPSVVLDAAASVEIQRPGSLFESPAQGDRRAIQRRIVDTLRPVGWVFHPGEDGAADHLHDAADMVRVEFQDDAVVLFVRQQAAGWAWDESGLVLGTFDAFAADFSNQISKLETTSLLALWEREAGERKARPKTSAAVEDLPRPTKGQPVIVRYSEAEGVLLCGPTKPHEAVLKALRMPYTFRHSPTLPQGCAWYVPRTRGTVQPFGKLEAVVVALRRRGVPVELDYVTPATRVARATAHVVEPAAVVVAAERVVFPKSHAERVALLRRRLAAEGWVYHPSRSGTRRESIVDPTDTVRLVAEGGSIDVETRIDWNYVGSWQRHDELIGWDLLAQLDADFEAGIRKLLETAKADAAKRATIEAELTTRYVPTSELKPVPEGAEPVILISSSRRASCRRVALGMPRGPAARFSRPRGSRPSRWPCGRAVWRRASSISRRPPIRRLSIRRASVGSWWPSRRRSTRS